MNLIPRVYEIEAIEGITIERRRGRDATKWAVVRNGLVLAKDGAWEYEPLPSNREDDFLARCRFDSIQEACDAVEKL